MNKFFHRLLIAGILLSLLAGCGGPASSPQAAATPEAPASVLATASPTPAPTPPPEGKRISVLGVIENSPVQSILDRVIPALNELLAQQGYDFYLEYSVVAASLYYSELESGAHYDLFPINDYTTFVQYARQGFLADLTDALAAFPQLAETLAPPMEDMGRVEGRQYALTPVAEYAYNGTYESGLLLRQDILDALDAQPPSDALELHALCLAAKEAGLDYELALLIQAPAYFQHRTYPQWPFYVDGNSLILYSDSQAVSYLESDQFVRDNQTMGLFFDDELLQVIDGAQEDFAKNWDALGGYMPVPAPAAGSVHEQDVFVHQFAPDRETFRMKPYSEVFLAVSSSCESVERVLSFVHALYGQQQVYDAFMYGQRGVDWDLDGDGRFQKLIQNPMNVELFGHQTLDRLVQSDPFYSSMGRAGLATSLVDFPGPHFRPYDLFTMTYPLLGTPTYNGVLMLRYDQRAAELVDSYIQRLKAEGLDELVQETNRQYQQYLDGLK